MASIGCTAEAAASAAGAARRSDLPARRSDVERPPQGRVLTLRERLARRERERFVGRSAELAFLGSLLVDDPPVNVVLLHGPAGIGKSALLRQVARAGTDRGWQLSWVRGRELTPTPQSVGDALARARGSERPLVLLDDYDSMAALGAHLRRDVLPALPERAVVVIAARTAPECAWFEGGWETVAVAVELPELSNSEAIELLRAHGVHDVVQQRQIVERNGGNPLALVLAATVRAKPTIGTPADRQSTGAVNGRRAGDVNVEIVRDVLRDLQLPHRLAASPLAKGDSLAARASSVRAVVCDAVDHAFGPSPDDQLTRRVLTLAYLEPVSSKEQAADEVMLSRSAYFRRLKRGVERIAEYLDQGAHPGCELSLRPQ